MVHNLPQAQAALHAAADCGVSVILESPLDAALSWGAPYFLKLIAAAREAAPAAQCEAILDCGDAPGLALDALQRGVKIIRLRAKKDVIARVADIAGQHGARIETQAQPKDLLDLDGARDPYKAALSYFEGRRS
jgi:hypothetical protein